MVPKAISDKILTNAPFDVEQATSLLAALADPARYEMVRLIMHRWWSLHSLHEHMGISRNKANRQMKIICEAGIARARRKGRVIYYCSDSEAVARIIAHLKDL